MQRLIGAPPGYVGYEEGGQLTEAVRRRPYSVILLDEIEKAHPDVFGVLLQVLDDGRLTDGQGRIVSFKNAIVIMTSNVGSQFIQAFAEGGASEEERDRMLQEALRATFRPEFLNRIDDVVTFHALSLDDIASIVVLQLEEVRARLAERKIALELTDAAVERLVARRVRPGVRRAAAQADHPARGGRPGRQGAHRGQRARGRHGHDRRRRRRATRSSSVLRSSHTGEHAGASLEPPAVGRDSSDSMFAKSGNPYHTDTGRR